MIFGGQVRSVEDIDFLERAGFSVGEVALTSKQACEYWLRSGVRNGLGQGLPLIAHGPGEGPPNDIKNLWTKVIPALEDTVVTCAAMAIRFLTIHLWTDSRFVKHQIVDHKIVAIGHITTFANDLGVEIGIENLSENADDLERALAGAPHLSITLDVGHGQLLCTRNTSFEIIERLSSRISHIHLHDNLGGNEVRDDLHLPIGEGIVDFRRILGALMRKGYKRTATLEVKRHELISSKARLEKILEAVRGEAAASYSAAQQQLR